MNDEIDELKAELLYLRKKLSDISSPLEAILGRRGFSIYKKEAAGDVLRPSGKYHTAFYNKLQKYSFRLFLRDIIKFQDSFSIDDVTRYATKRVSKQYLDFLLKAEIAESYESGYRLRKRPVRSFGDTLEWFIAQMVESDFSAETVWGASFKRAGIGGDYDLLAKLDSDLLYMEIKSSPPKQIYDSEITSFLNRVHDLTPDVAIFFVDTELRMKDKIVPMFEKALESRFRQTVPVIRIRKELFHISNKIFIINSKGGISRNISAVLSFKYREDYKLL